MSKTLPESWGRYKLGEALEIHDNERKPINNSERSSRIENKEQSSLFPYYGATGQVGWIDDFLSNQESVLVGEDAAPFLDPIKNKAYLVKGKFWVNNHAHILRGIKNFVDNRFILHQMNHVDYHAHVSGSTRLKLTKTALTKMPFLLCPYNEQIRIADKIDELFSELDSGIGELNAAQVKLTQYRQSLLKNAMDGELTQIWRNENKGSNEETGEQLLERILIERKQSWEQQKLAEFKAKDKTPPKNWQKKYPEPVEPDISNLPELPQGWVWATIDQLATNKRYGSSSKTNDDTNGVPVLRMGNIQGGKLDYGNLKYLPKDHKEFPELLLADGDLLFNRTNSAELVGKTAIYKDIGKPVSYASYLISVTFSEYFLPEIAAHYINSVIGKKWIAEVMNQTAGQANVNGTKLGALAIPLPPIAEQKALVKEVSNEFDSIDRQIEATALGLKQSEAQRRNILKSAFSGELVPQNSSDEPASVLLEKIKKEREELAKQAKPKKTRQPKKKVNMMDTLLEVLTAEDDWIDAQEAFQKSGVKKNTSSDVIEKLYLELRELINSKQVEVMKVNKADKLRIIKNEAS